MELSALERREVLANIDLPPVALTVDLLMSVLLTPAPWQSEYESETSHAMGSMGRKKEGKRKEQQYRIFKVRISSDSQSVASYYDFEDAPESKGANHGGRGNDQ